MSFTTHFKKIAEWNHPEDWMEIETIDAHTGGEPLRIILSGLPEIKGKTILEKRRYMKENLDHYRTALMFEPRGHADMYGCVITPPVTDDSDFGVIFMHNEGYSTMCGHGIIAITKVVLETGMFEMIEPVTQIKIDSPAGLITSHARIKNGKVESVYLHNVPSFLYKKDLTFDVPSIGKINFDIAYGGAFYAFVKAEQLGLTMRESEFREMIEKGMMIKRAVMQNFEIKHPFNEELSFLYGTIFYGNPLSKDAASRNVCVFAEGEVDRSPTGTGVSARAALHFAKGELEFNKPLIIESIIGSKFSTKVIEKTSFGIYDAVIPEVEGTAHITGMSTFYIDPKDDLKNGFILR
ncbi:MAG: proline racemase [Ignavibacteria bacterium]|nr:MAG: proline racemase [Ignavibacteria bacterium]KAF0160687.1 MAG: proline racemase [Ignavibacteria bacterium]